MTDKQLFEKFEKELRQPNLIVADVAACVRIAKEYAKNLIKNKIKSK